MNKIILLIYILILLYIGLKNPIHKMNNWYYKKILIYILTCLITISILFNNKFNDTYLIPFIIFINIAILIYISLTNTYTIYNLLPLIGIVYILYTFNYKDFRFKNGKLVKPNKLWIAIHIVVLILYYLMSNKSFFLDKYRIIAILLIIYPLIFPLNEYFIHRAFILALAFSFYNYNKKYKIITL